MRMYSEVTALQKCPKGPIKIIISAKFSSGDVTSGTVRLTHRLNNIIAMKVLYFNVTNTLDAAASGNFLVLSSSQLGNQISKNPFQVCDINDEIFGVVRADSDIIAVTLSGTTNAEQSLIFNDEIKFCSSQCIDQFDWRIDKFGSGDTIPDVHAVDILIAFYPACNCDPFK